MPNIRFQVSGERRAGLHPRSGFQPLLWCPILERFPAFNQTIVFSHLSGAKPTKPNFAHLLQSTPLTKNLCPRVPRCVAILGHWIFLSLLEISSSADPDHLLTLRGGPQSVRKTLGSCSRAHCAAKERMKRSCLCSFRATSTIKTSNAPTCHH